MSVWTFGICENKKVFTLSDETYRCILLNTNKYMFNYLIVELVLEIAGKLIHFIKWITSSLTGPYLQNGLVTRQKDISLLVPLLQCCEKVIR